MFDKEKEHQFFGACWAMFNTVRKDNTDEGWKACMETAHVLCEGQEHQRFHEQIAIAIVDEAEAEAAMQGTEKTTAYKAAGKTFQSAWKLVETLMEAETLEDCAMKQMTAFYQDNAGRFARYLGTAIYDFVCKERRVSGSFLKEAYQFYDKYKAGISEKEEAAANAEAETIIDVHPEYTLQMMDMYAGLQQRARIVAA